MDIAHVFQFIIDKHALQWYTMYTHHILMKMWHGFIASTFWYCLVQSVYHVTTSVLNVIHTSPQFQMQRIEILYIVGCILRGIYCAEQFDIPCQHYRLYSSDDHQACVSYYKRALAPMLWLRVHENRGPHHLKWLHAISCPTMSHVTKYKGTLMV